MGQITHDLVLEVLDGCAPSARREAAALGKVTAVGPTELRLRTGDLDAVRGLHCVVAASLSLAVPARRPRELRETSAQQRVGEMLEAISRQRPRQRFTGLRLEAAGSGTEEMQDLATVLAERAGVPVDADGDLVVRVRRDREQAIWELLLRTTPRPLSTRAWRTVNYPGAVNATIAAAVLDLMEVRAEDAVLDLTCGSGTFLIEQLHRAVPVRAVGIDLDPAAIDAAHAHQRAARRRGRIDWTVGDARMVDLEGGFTRILSNPPWGTLHGEHATNEGLLRDLLRRGAELSGPTARMGVLTHEIRRMHTVLDASDCPWQLVDEHRFFQKGHHPRLFRLALR